MHGGNKAATKNTMQQITGALKCEEVEMKECEDEDMEDEESDSKDDEEFKNTANKVKKGTKSNKQMRKKRARSSSVESSEKICTKNLNYVNVSGE